MINKHKIISIVAVDDNWAIGKNNQLLYNVPTDMKFFRQTTTENIVVYGLNTLNSFPNRKPLPNRTNFVLSPQEVNISDVTTALSIDDLIKKIQNIDNDKCVFICGGASVYKQMIDMCDEAYVTKIKAKTKDADVFFPNLDCNKSWKLTNSTEEIKDEKSNLIISFNIYKKTDAGI